MDVFTSWSCDDVRGNYRSGHVDHFGRNSQFTLGDLSVREFAEGLPDLFEKNDGSVADVRSGTV